MVQSGNVIPAAIKLSSVVRLDAKCVSFVEEKPVDYPRIQSLLEQSSLANQWTNFGPVSKRLEQKIAQYLDLDDDLCIVMCASGTAALHGIVSLHETLHNADLSWLCSSFGYYSSINGPLQRSKIIDCNTEAMLPLESLSMHDYDAFIVTNVFGQEHDLSAYREYASKHNKLMVVDSALGFGSHHHRENEFISFHHTKPWGFGEGGCAIIRREHEELFRNIINFGQSDPMRVNRRAFNGKISEPSCAFTQMRLEHMKIRKLEYREQYERIASIAKKCGLSILKDVSKHPGIPGSVPVLAPKAFADFSLPDVPSGRYYRPLAQTRCAEDIYSRIVNVPCHSDMRSVSDVQFTHAFNGLLDRI